MKLLQEHISDYLSYITTQGKSPRTVVQYRLLLDHFTNFTGNIKLEDLTIPKILDYQNHIKDNGFADSTKHYHSVVLRAFLKYCNKIGYLAIPSIAIELPKFRKKEVEFLSEEDVDRILKAADSHKNCEIRDRAILELLASTGCRVSELTHLKLENIDLAQREVRIINGKGGKDRCCFLTPQAVHYLREYLSRRKNENTDYLFHSGINGQSLTSRSVERLVKKYGELAGIPASKCHPHSFRHHFASKMLQRGADLKSVKEMLGHNSIATTDMYLHTTNPQLKKAFDNANASFAVGTDGSPVKNEFIVLAKKDYYHLVGQINKNRELLIKICKKIGAR